MEVIIQIATFLLVIGSFYGAIDAKHKSSMRLLERNEQDLKDLSQKFVTQVQFNQVLLQIREEREFLRQDLQTVQRDIKEILSRLK